MNAPIAPTIIDLPVEVRANVIVVLNQQLADALDLALQTRQAHWNVKGPHFIALHEFFDDAGETLDECIDELAERVVTLGGTAHGTLQAVAQATRLAAYPLSARNEREHLSALSASLAAFGKTVRAAAAVADEKGDATTADLFTSVSRAADKLLWKVEAHSSPAP